MLSRFDPSKKYIIDRWEITRLKSVSRPIFRPSGSVGRPQTKQDLVFSRLSDLLTPPDGVIDGDAVKNAIFPTAGEGFPDFNVFISHSHNDIDKAEALAKYLKSIGNEPFLDNYVWSSADRLIEEIDGQYCLTPDGKYYDYEKRNFSTSHVHTMLSMAILEMIARCESFIFIESDESIDYEELRETGKKTQSPWIYQELQYVRMLSAALRPLMEQREYSDSKMSLNIRYGADLTDFTELTTDNIDRYLRNRRI